MTYLERFEYLCRECGKKGTVLDVLLNPDLLLIRGFCSVCKKRGTYKVIDIEALRKEHQALDQEESRKRSPSKSSPGSAALKVQKPSQVKWKWELQNGGRRPASDSDD